MSKREKSRAGIIVKTSFIAIITNTLLVGFKVFVGLVSNSIAIVLDALNNLTDAISSVVTIVGAKLANKRPDKKHPYGYGRIEYFSTIVVAALVLVAGVTAGRESFVKILESGDADYSISSLIIIAAAVAVKLVLGFYLQKVGKKVDSGSLVASGKDSMMDSILSFATLIGAILNVLFGLKLEGYLGVLIAIFIMKTGVEMLLETLDLIIGKRADADIINKIRKTLKEFPDVQGVYDLSLHNYGPSKIIATAHIQVPDKMTADTIHKLTREMAYACFEKYGVIITIGIYAANDQRKYRTLREQVFGLAKEYPEILQVHGFYVDEAQNVYFDLVIDFICQNPEELSRKLISELEAANPGFAFNIILDADISD